MSNVDRKSYKLSLGGNPIKPYSLVRSISDHKILVTECLIDALKPYTKAHGAKVLTTLQKNLTSN